MRRWQRMSFFLIAGLLAQINLASAGEDLVKRGRYVVEIGGCNDCHTPGYAEQGGQLPVNQWLTGNPVGFKGPWGITFPVNLRLLMQSMTEDQWVAKARTFATRPPMPWFNVRLMTETYQRAVYQFIRSLGPAGTSAPQYVPPGTVTKNMFIPFVPVSAEAK